MGSLERRVDRLEEGLPKGKPCPECGRTPGGPWPGVRLVKQGDPGWNPRNEFCASCGEPLAFTLDIGARPVPWPEEEDL